MTIRFVRRRLTAENALTVAVATTAITHELADMLQFPPARVATGILLLIFKTIQDIQTNRDECYRLASRCLRLLTDLRDAMDGRWEDAPEPLLKTITKFEGTLQAIHDDLTQEAESKWRNRLMRKKTIETALVEYNLLVDDAARSFQIATLIHIHYTIGRSQTLDDSRSTTFSEEVLRPAGDVAGLYSGTEVCDTPRSMTFSEGALISQQDLSDDFTVVDASSIESAVPAAIITGSASQNKHVQAELDTLDDRGFRRYHQSEVALKSHSKIKSGWWAGARDVQVNGRHLSMLQYEGPYGPAAKRWLRDVKTLQNVYHPNLPQMVGYSGTDTPTPFILLANVQTRLPQAMVLDALKNASLLDCARLLIRFYKDIFDAAIYMQRQLSLTDSKIQDYVEHASFRIEGYDTMVMGLPPPEVYNMQSWRNFGLAHSIRDIFIQLIPNRGLSSRPYNPDDTGSPEMQRKVNHLGLIVRSVLPSGNDECHEASARLQELLDDDEDEEAEPLSLPMIRMAAIRARTHGHSWNHNFVPAYMFKLGDVGYVPPGEQIKSFVRIANVLDEGLVDLDLTTHATGRKIHFDFGRFDQQDLQPFLLPGDVYSWPLVIEAGSRQNVNLVHEEAVRYVSDAWKTLLHRAPELALAHGVKPQDLMLVTRAGIDQRFIIHDTRSIPSSHTHRSPGFPAPQFGGTHAHHRHFQHSIPGFGPPPPAVFYAYTSVAKEHEPYISDAPVYLPPALQAQRPPMQAKCIWGLEGTYGFMNYVQLHEEDFC
ncbi:hypothetical protein BC835DRAFT_1419088 [Cytidiella melzeri]|nr:hypothetical protein BC835DRAFT_1419088 [Cytidiella melzeri]